MVHPSMEIEEHEYAQRITPTIQTGETAGLDRNNAIE